MRLSFRRRSLNRGQVRQVLLGLRDALVASLDENLTALIVYGDYVKPDLFDPAHSQVSLMLVSECVDAECLDKITDAIAKAERQAPLAMMILTREDLRSSCDVFPVKFHDMQLHHQLLHGHDVVSELEISDKHLRLRCEQELKNILIRLRAIYVHRSQGPQQLHQSLFDASRSLQRLMHACLTVKSAVIPEDATDLITGFGGAFDLDTSILEKILGLGNRNEEPDITNLKRMFDEFIQLVHDVAQTVDRVEAEV